jgi:GcrA cell cycle regulator
MVTIDTTWTDERVRSLKTLYGQGLSRGKIAAELGVTRNAVIGKISRLAAAKEEGFTLQVDAKGRKRSRASDDFKSASGTTTKRARTAKPSDGKKRVVSSLKKALAVAPVCEEVVITGTRAPTDEDQTKCQWPISIPGASDFGYCSNTRLDPHVPLDRRGAVPYCAGHARMAYKVG